MNPSGRRQGAVFAALAALALVASVAVAATTVSFGDTRTNVSQDSTTNSNRPEIAVSVINGVGGDIVHFVWREATGSIFYRRSRDGGTTFDTTLTIASGGTNRGDPKIATEGDEVVIVWNENGALHARFSGDSGQSFPNDSRIINASQNADTWAFAISSANLANPATGSNADFVLAWIRTTDSMVHFARQFATSTSNDTFETPVLLGTATALLGGDVPVHSLAVAYEPQNFSLGDSTAITGVVAMASPSKIYVLDVIDHFDTATGALRFTEAGETVVASGNATAIGIRTGLAAVIEGNDNYFAWIQRDIANAETDVLFDHNRNGAAAPSQNFKDAWKLAPSEPDPFYLINAERVNSIYGPDVRISTTNDGFCAVGNVSMRPAEGSNRLQIVFFEYDCDGNPDTGRIVQRTLSKPGPGQPVDLSDTGGFIPANAPNNGAGAPTKDGRVAVVFTDDSSAGITDIFTVTSQTLDGNGPMISSVTFVDNDGDSAVSAGDTLHIVFSETFTIVTPLAPSDFTLPVTGDIFGISNTSDTTFINVKSGASFVSQTAGLQSSIMRITIGSESPVLTVNGVFSAATLAVGSPSGIDLVNQSSTLSKLQDLEGNAAVANATAVDISGSLGVDTASENADTSTTTATGAHPGASPNPQTCLLGRVFEGAPALLAALRAARDALLGAPAGRAVVTSYYRPLLGLGLALAPVLSFPLWRRTRRNSSPN